MFEFRIVPDVGEPFEVEAGMRDLRLWEKTHRGRNLGVISDKANISATIMFEIAYAACRRQGKLPAGVTSDQFAEQFDIEIMDDEPEAPPAPPAGEDDEPEGEGDRDQGFTHPAA